MEIYSRCTGGSATSSERTNKYPHCKIYFEANIEGRGATLTTMCKYIDHSKQIIVYGQKNWYKSLGKTTGPSPLTSFGTIKMVIGLPYTGWSDYRIFTLSTSFVQIAWGWPAVQGHDHERDIGRVLQFPVHHPRGTSIHRHLHSKKISVIYLKYINWNCKPNADRRDTTV